MPSPNVDLTRNSRPQWLQHDSLSMPPVALSLAPDVLEIWIKLEAEVYYRNRDVDTFDGHLALDDDRRQIFLEYGRVSCEEWRSAPCGQFNDLQLYIHLRTPYEKQIWEGRDDVPPPIQSGAWRAANPSALENYYDIDDADSFVRLFLYIDLLEATVSEGHRSDEETLKLLTRAERTLANILPFMPFDVEERFPYASNLLDMRKAQIRLATAFAQHRRLMQIPKSEEEEHKLSLMAANALEDMDVAGRMILERPDVPRLLKARTANRVGAIMGRLSQDLYLDGQQRTNMLSKADWFQQQAVRTIRRYEEILPLYASTIYTNHGLLTTFVHPSDVGQLRRADKYLSRAIEIGRNYGSPGIASTAYRVRALVAGRTAGLTRNPVLFCRGVQLWYESARYPGRTGLLLGLDRLSAEFDLILFAFRRSAARNYFDGCIEDVGASVERVHNDLDQMEPRVAELCGSEPALFEGLFEPSFGGLCD